MIVGLESWTLARPEIFLAAATALLLIYGVVRGEIATPFVSVATSVALLVTAALLFLPYREGTAFSSLFIVDRLTATMKALVLVGSAIAILMSRAYFEQARAWRFEYPILVALATLGMMLMISANDLMALYVGLELQSLALYVVAAFQRDSVRSTEAGVKYFVLGSVASGMLLFGSSLIYGFCGGTAFVQISGALTDGRATEIGVIIGLVFVVAGLAFKVSAVPFHMWTPDVYEGAPTSITAYMATGIKAAAFGAFLRVFYTAFLPFAEAWSGILWVIAAATMTLGNITALVQDDIKRMLAYSSIAHAGYILIAFVIGDAFSASAMLFYILVYTFMNVGAFAIVILLGQKEQPNTGIESYAGLAGRHPLIALAMALFLLSLTGIPPLAGFMGKFYMFGAAIRAEYYWLAVIGVLNSTVAAYYYLRVIVFMYFREAAGEPCRPDFSPAYAAVIVISLWALFHMGIFPRDFLLIAVKSVSLFLSGS